MTQLRVGLVSLLCVCFLCFHNGVRQKAAAGPASPFSRRIPAPEFPSDLEWLNTSGPLRMQDLRGKFVLLDFWTYCCINCMHILPELKKLEHAYSNELVVIGVHSAKFATEKTSQNIEEAILRYEIEHPVLNDAEHVVWKAFGVRSWPTVLLIDPEGNVVWGLSGEFEAKVVKEVLDRAIPYYRRNKLLDETPVRFDLLAHRQQRSPLLFPGKVLADEAGGRLFITDSNHHRVVIADLDGKWIDTIGSGREGRANGPYAESSFHHPQGLALGGASLYVADTENHLIRKVDLKAKRVRTIAGTGLQRRGMWPGMQNNANRLPGRFVGKPSATAIASPWALWIHEPHLYIAMAGPHQIWRMPLDESEIGPYAGNGREDIVDGLLLPRQPYFQKPIDESTGQVRDPPGFSSFAQPSGLTSDGAWLYVADSEGSSIRAVPFDAKQVVRTVVGTSRLPRGRLFLFGDRNGPREKVLLQHPLGVSHHDGTIYVADTYNNKIKAVNVKTGATRTVAGTGEPGSSDKPAPFDEPGGLSYARGILYVADTNNHAIRTVDTSTGAVGTLQIQGLAPPDRRVDTSRPKLADATRIDVPQTSVGSTSGKMDLEIELTLPAGWKINSMAPMRYWLTDSREGGPLGKLSAGPNSVAEPGATLTLRTPIMGDGEDTLEVAVIYYYCQEDGAGLCKVGSVIWTVPIQASSSAPDGILKLFHTVVE
ncbi:MAG: thioredoxin-like domain-containing protein [Pirellulaceae bacterium]